MYEATRPTTGAGPSPNPNSKPKPKSNFLRTAHSLALADLRTRWRSALLWTTYLAALIIFILALSIALSTSAPAQKPKFNDAVACLPDGRFSLDPGGFSFWGGGGFFEITMGYGEFTFTQAKAIDVGWDVVVGRGGQAILALISGNVFARYVTSTMQVAPVTFNTFRTIFLQRDANTAMGLTKLVRDFSRRKGLQSKVAAVFMVLSMVFVVVFPTFVGAMSGYSANVEAFVEDQSERCLVPFRDFSHWYYTIHDGKRINRSENVQIASPSRNAEPLLYTIGVCSSSNRGSEYQEQCDLMDDVSAYVLEYGIGGATKNTTHFGKNNTEISSPSLNITAYYIPTRYWNSVDGFHGNYQKVLTPSGRTRDLSDSSHMAWTAGAASDSNGEAAAYDEAYLEGHGQCQPTKTYKWGFSFIQLFLMVLLLTCWAIGTYILYIRAHIAMLKRGHDTPVAGEYQAVFQLADAMNAQLDQDCDKVEKSDVAVLSEEQLRRRIGKDLKGGAISYKDSLLRDGDARNEGPAWRTRDVLMKEIWWLAALVIAVAACLVTAWFYPYFVASYLLPLQVVFAMHVGQKGRSRLVLLFWMVLVLSVTPTAVVMSMLTVKKRK